MVLDYNSQKPFLSSSSNCVSPKLNDGNELSKGCIGAILSYTTLVNACMLSVVSKTFFPLYQSPSLAIAPTEKALYLALFDPLSLLTMSKVIFLCNPQISRILGLVIVNNIIVSKLVFLVSNIRSFQLDKRSGKKCDGWLEIEMGEFFNPSLEDEEVQMSVIVNKSVEKKRNFFLLRNRS
ncbi:phloem protein [Medicago truncatula]|uniref:Phloem protein n=1 Tax=Medicago truncatula TaxID=3880 RepID=G7I5K3_MEDTR|nr:phloem protein [Medicago truncatula]